MSQSGSLSRFVWVLGAAVVLLALNACGGGGAQIDTPPSLRLVATTLAKGTLGTAYSQTLTATGGVPPYTWSVTKGSLPSGLTLNSSTGLISGTIGGVKTAINFTATVTDSQTPVANTATATLGITAVSPIQHLVIIFQENRTPDNLFQDQNLIKAGADIQNFGVNSTGQTITLGQIDLGTNGSNPDNYDLSHAHSAFVSMCDLNATTGICAMDGADLIKPGCGGSGTDCWPPNPQFMYVNPADAQPYFQMAEQYTFADRMFQTNQGPSFPAHQFIISGTSAPCSQALPCPGAGSNLFAAENPKTSDPPDAGCDAPVGSTVLLIDPTGSETSNAPIYPCFEHQTLTDLLETKSLTSRYYAPGISPPTPPIHSAL